MGADGGCGNDLTEESWRRNQSQAQYLALRPGQATTGVAPSFVQSSWLRPKTSSTGHVLLTQAAGLETHLAVSWSCN